MRLRFYVLATAVAMLGFTPTTALLLASGLIAMAVRRNRP